MANEMRVRKRRERDKSAPTGRGEVGAVFALIAAALALRLAALGTPSLWHDEALEYVRAAGNLRTAFLGRPIDQDPPLFAVFNHAWVHFGVSEWWLRVPSALLGAVTVFMAGIWAGRRFGSRTGRLTALVMAVAPVLVHYSQELNQYAAMVFLTVVVLIAWDKVVVLGRPQDWRRYTAFSVIALGTHYGMGFPLAAMGVFLAWQTRMRRPEPRPNHSRAALPLYVLICGSTIGALWFLGLRDRLALPHHQARFGGTHFTKELDYLADTLWREVLVFFTLPMSGGPALWIVGALVLIAATGAVDLWRRGPTGRRLVAIVFVGSLALTYPADGLGWYPLGYRWALYAAPAFFIALAAGLAWLWGQAPPLGGLMTLAVVGTGLVFAPQADDWNPWLAVPREEMRAVVARLTGDIGPMDLLYVSPGANPAFRYYANLATMQWNVRTASIWGTAPGENGYPSEAEHIANAAARSRRIWLLLARPEAGEEAGLLGALAHIGWVESGRVTEPGVSLVLLRSLPTLRTGR